MKGITAGQLMEIKYMVDAQTGSNYIVQILRAKPDIIELVEDAEKRAWIEGQTFIDIKVGAEKICGRKLRLRELVGESRILQLTPQTEGQEWPTT